jgi:hypothetical protein
VLYVYYYCVRRQTSPVSKMSTCGDVWKITYVRYRNKPPFILNFSYVCLSRACLGKYSVSNIEKWRKEGVRFVFTVASANSHISEVKCRWRS